MSDPGVSMNDWLNEHDDLYFRLVIPAALKWEIRDKLDQINITDISRTRWIVRVVENVVQ